MLKFVLFLGLDPKLPEFMKRKRRAVPQSNTASAEDSVSITSSKSSETTQETPDHLSSTKEPQPGTSTGGVTPSGPQVNTATRQSARCAAKGRGWKGSGYDSSDQSSSDSSSGSDSGDEEWRPDTSSDTARKTNNPSGKF